MHFLQKFVTITRDKKKSIGIAMFNSQVKKMWRIIQRLLHMNPVDYEAMKPGYRKRGIKTALCNVNYRAMK
jgi:hypothetical protein